ncbi:RL22 protein, partial [Polypterus senegalus]
MGKGWRKVILEMRREWSKMTLKMEVENEDVQNEDIYKDNTEDIFACPQSADFSEEESDLDLHSDENLEDPFQFLDEQKAVSVIPQSWYSDGTTFWPNYKSDQILNKAARYAEEPGPDWTKNDVRVLKSYGDYMSAWQGMKTSLTCQTSELDSDDQEDIGRVKRAPKPMCHLLTSHYCSLKIHQQISTSLPKMKNTSELFKPTYRVGQCGTEPIPCTAADLHILTLLEHVKHQLSQLAVMISSLSGRLNIECSPDMPEEVQFPLQSLEAWLKQPTNALKKKNMKKQAAKGGKKKKQVLKFTLDCTHPVEDGIMDAANFEQFLQERIKVNGKAGNLGGGVVTIERSKSKITVTSEVPFSKRQVN